jgi:hypothetical protein
MMVTQTGMVAVEVKVTDCRSVEDRASRTYRRARGRGKTQKGNRMPEQLGDGCHLLIWKI